MTDKIDLSKMSRDEILSGIKSKEIASYEYDTFQDYQKKRLKLGYAPVWTKKHYRIVEKSLKSKSIPMTFLEAIMKI